LQGVAGNGFWLAASLDAQVFVSCGCSSHRVQLWRRTAAGGFEAEELPDQPGALPHRALAVAITPDGQTVATANSDGTVRVCSLAGKPRSWRTLAGHQGPVVALAFAPDGKTLASAGEDRTVRMWSVEAGQAAGPPLTGIAVQALAFAPDGKTLATGGSGQAGGDVRLWDLVSGGPRQRDVVWKHAHTRAVTCLAFTADGEMLVTGGADGQVVVRGPGSGNTLANWRLAGPVRGLAVASDARHLAVANGNSTVYVIRFRPAPGGG
jgi:WD40 repeat protein